jgi:hypothetical protein
MAVVRTTDVMCCFCSYKGASAGNLKNHYASKPACHAALDSIIAEERARLSPSAAATTAAAAATTAPAATTAIPSRQPVETRVATRPIAASSQAKAAALTAAWVWAASLSSASLPSLYQLQSVRRLPRSQRLKFDLLVAMVLSRLDANPHDAAAHNIMFLIPRIILRRDPAPTVTPPTTAAPPTRRSFASTRKRCQRATASNFVSSAS